MKFSTAGGMGAALMKDKQNATNIVKALSEKFGHKLSVSCKIRCLDNFDDTLDFVLSMQNEGKAHFITIHPRTQSEKSQVPAKWFIVKKVIDS